MNFWLVKKQFRNEMQFPNHVFFVSALLSKSFKLISATTLYLGSVQEKNLVVRETPAGNARTIFGQYDPEGKVVCVPVNGLKWGPNRILFLRTLKEYV